MKHGHVTGCKRERRPSNWYYESEECAALLAQLDADEAAKQTQQTHQAPHHPEDAAVASLAHARRQTHGGEARSSREPKAEVPTHPRSMAMAMTERDARRHLRTMGSVTFGGFEIWETASREGWTGHYRMARAGRRDAWPDYVLHTGSLAAMFHYIRTHEAYGQ